jgi:hypothetical protein
VGPRVILDTVVVDRNFLPARKYVALTNVPVIVSCVYRFVFRLII